MDKKILIFGMLFMIIFVAYIVITIFKIPIFSLTQAANENKEADISTSLIFAWPLEVKADGKERSEVSVFIRDNNGRGIPEKDVRLSASLGDIQSTQSQTDSQGKIVFYISSTTNGVAQIEALVDNRKLQKTISVKFE